MSRSVLLKTLLLSLGLGWIAGGIEALKIGFSLPWHFELQELSMLLFAALLSGAILSLIFGVVGGVIAGLSSDTHPTTSWAVGMSITGFLLACWFVVPLGYSVWNDGRAGLAIGVWATIILFTFIIWQNSFFWIRRSFKHGAGRFQWWWLSFLVALVMVAIAVGGALQKGYGNKRAIESDPDVIVVSIDGLSAKAVSGIAGVGSLAQTPNLDSWISKCIRYDNAISPSSEVLPAHSSMITGIYPGQTGVINNEAPFRFQFDTITEKFAEEGYATAAFLSHSAFHKDSGFDQGFQLYDDDNSPWIHGLRSIQLVDLLLQLADEEELLRTAGETLREAQLWFQSYQQTPAFLWIQLQIPDELTKDEYATQVAKVDTAVGDFLRGLHSRDVPRKYLLIITSAHGMHWKTGSGQHDGISDAAVHVPLIICPVSESSKKVVSQQVRLMDLFNTINGQLSFSNVKEVQSADIVAVLDQPTFTGYPIFLLGKDGKSLVNGYELGYRLQGKNSDYYYKYVWYSTRLQHGLYNVSKDPEEQNDISSEFVKMTTTLATSTINAADAIKGIEIPETDTNLENIQSVIE